MTSVSGSALTQTGVVLQTRIARLVGRWPFWAVFVALVFAFPLVRALLVDMPEPPPVLGRVSDFELVDQNARPFGSAQLRGKVWVANFVFTRCPTICPAFMQRMAEVQQRGRNLGGAFHMVTFTVDPENDTPPRLYEYSRRFHANPRRWTLVTGPEPTLRRVIRESMKIGMGREGTAGADARSPGGEVVDPTTGIFHGTRFVLVDAGGRIRGYYEPTSEGVDGLMRDIGLLVNLEGASLRADPGPTS